MADKFSFNSLPSVSKKRSAFDLSHSVKTSMSAGKLYPIYVQEVYPGDTFKDHTSIVARVTSSFLKPVMDNCFMDTFFFFVPNRLVMTNWSAVMGENTRSAWAPTSTTTVPTASSGEIASKSVADYLGLPVGSIMAGVNILPFRAFALIWDEWFRDQNNEQPMNISKGINRSDTEVFNNGVWSPNNYFGQLPPVNKVHDYFTSCLPSPQKGSAVDILKGGTLEVTIPQQNVMASTSTHLMTNPIQFEGEKLGFSSGVLGFYNGNVAHGTLDSSIGFTTTANDQIMRSNLIVPESSQITSAYDSLAVNDLRYAIALQRMLEKDALGGTRYTEYLLAHFGVSSPDARLNRTELLGGHRFPISVQQVAQTSQATSDSPLGNVGAYSLSNGACRYTKGFVEHGFVIGVACIKQYHTYQQGVERFWFRSQRTDYYDPVFAHLGEQPVYKNELCLTGSKSGTLKGAVFGYNEYCADLRYRPNRVTGEMHSDIENSLDIWHFADNYANQPTLNSQFVNETPTYIDRTLSVPSTSQDQFIVDIYHKQVAYRCMPLYSIPSTLGV